MTENGNDGPSLGTLTRKLLTTGAGAAANRAELLMVELHQERNELISLIVLGMSGLFLGMTTVLLLTGTIIFIFPEPYRVYVAGAFAFLYFVGAIGSLIGLRLLLKRALSRAPFSESLNQLRKDRELLEAFK